MVYGYARVSTKGQAEHGNGLEAQKNAVREAGAEKIYADECTGTKTLERPELAKLLTKIEPGDKLIVTKLDRIARSAIKGTELVEDLLSRGITVHILNMGVLDNTPTGKLIRTIFFAFAEFERDLIVERTQEGKEVARESAKANGKKYKEGRPYKYTSAQIEHALSLLKNYSYKQVEEMTGISKITLIRRRKKIKDENTNK